VLFLVSVPSCDVMMLRACSGQREDQNHKKSLKFELVQRTRVG
jgi:hypothetical protein